MRGDGRGVHRFNLFRKLPEDLQVASKWGSLVSCLSIMMMLWLMVSEFQAYVTTSVLTSVALDGHQEDQLQVRFNTTLHHVPCRFVQLDVSDHMGQVFHNVTKHVRLWQMKVDKSGHDLQSQDVKMSQGKEQTQRHDPVDYIHVGHGGEQMSTALDGDSFEEFMQKYDLVMVNFYVPWCPFCQALNPVWELTAGQIQEHPEFAESVKFARVDCTQVKSRRLCARAKVAAYPSLLIYVQGATRTRYLYGGPRTPIAIMTFLELFYRQVLNRDDVSFMENELPDQATNALLSTPTLSKELEDVVITQDDDDGSEGCRVVGHLGVHRVPGTIRMTVSSNAHSFDRGGIDLSHSVHTFGFGTARIRSSSREDPMSRQQFLALNWNITFEHYMKIVALDRFRRPGDDANADATTATASSITNLHGLGTNFPHERLYRYSSHSNQYNATGNMPSIYFTYDISPLVIQEKPKIVPLYHFLTNLCAIVGGTITILGIIESSVFHLSMALIQKIRLGKHH